MNFVTSPLHPSFTPKIELKKAPVVSALCEAMQSLYVDRGSSQEVRDKIIQSFIDRQEAVELDQQSFNPLLVFAESTTSNGTRVLPFKRGAFTAMRTITPSCIQIAGGQVKPTYDSILLLPQAILMLSLLNIRIGRIKIMPDFTPNAHMLEKHADKGSEPWEIYAWCVRDVIAKQGNLIKFDEKLALNDKKAFLALMNGQADTAEINGQLFQYENDEPVQDRP